MTARRLFKEHGMVGVLLLLCVFFSAATITEQSVLSGAEAERLGRRVAEAQGTQARVMIAVRDLPEEAAFADQTQRVLAGSGVEVAAMVKGAPSDARAAMERLASQPGKRLDAIVCTPASAAWLVFEEVAADFPALGNPELVTPSSRRWPGFLKRENLLNIASQIAVIAIVAIGMTVVIITGGIDLSVGSLIALAAVLAAFLVRDYAGGREASAMGMVIACAGAVLVCGAVGGFSGLMITRFAVPPFIVTLAMMLVCSGLAYSLAEGQSIAEVPDRFVWLGRETGLFGLPNAVLLMLGLYAAAHALMTQTRLGRHWYAVGGNREAAVLSGIRVRRVLLLAYVLSGLLAGLGGVVMASQLKSGSPTYGSMYELYVIAATVVGGASLRGGEGRMFGTLVGAFTIAVIQNGMNLLNVESYTQKVVLGFVILGAVLLDRQRRK